MTNVTIAIGCLTAMALAATSPNAAAQDYPGQLPDVSKALLVAITGYGREEDQKAAREAGFDLHLTKPVDPVRLERLIATLS